MHPRVLGQHPLRLPPTYLPVESYSEIFQAISNLEKQIRVELKVSIFPLLKFFSKNFVFKFHFFEIRLFYCSIFEIHFGIPYFFPNLNLRKNFRKKKSRNLIKSRVKFSNYDLEFKRSVRLLKWSVKMQKINDLAFYCLNYTYFSKIFFISLQNCAYS